MTALPLTLVCSGCGAEASPESPFRCPKARPGDDIDHLLTRVIDVGQVRFPRPTTQPPGSANSSAVAPDSTSTLPPVTTETNPFIRYRTLSLAWHLARAHGWSDARIVDTIAALDERVAVIEGHGFTSTPLRSLPRLRTAIGGPAELLAKDETGNVSGSHKARHLMGVMLYLQVAEALGIFAPGKPLAISSCGNAALAAAVVAAAARRPLDVFIPTWAEAPVVEQLRSLGARVQPCPRQADASGDPCTHAFRRAVAAGAIPFSCQGSDNGLAIEGGITLGYELVAELAALPPDRIFIQVGGGALGSAVIQAWREAKAWGLVDRLPRFHLVQTSNTAPLARAYRRLLTRISSELPAGTLQVDQTRGSLAARDARSLLLQREQLRPAIARALHHAATHRSLYMWPWEEQPRSIAHGILDDETYDWMELVRGMLTTGGYPLEVDEALLTESRNLVRRRTRVTADATGTAGLAGLLLLKQEGLLDPAERCVFLLTGIDRNGEAPEHL
jgi:threonine synthase